MNSRIWTWLAIFAVAITLTGALPAVSIAQSSGPTGPLTANGCTVKPKKPVSNDGLLEAPTSVQCDSDLAGRQIVFELWQKDNDDVWKEVQETDLTLQADLTFGPVDYGLDNISCRKLEQDRTRRFKTGVAVSDGNGNFTETFSDVETFGRDCLAGMDDDAISAAGLDAGSNERVRRPPKRAEVKKMKIKCRFLKDDPRLWRKADCPGDPPRSSDLTVSEELVGTCGKAWMWVTDVGSGRAILSWGWVSSLGPALGGGDSFVDWENRATGGRDSYHTTWPAGTSGQDGKTAHTGSGHVFAEHEGQVKYVVGQLLGPCTIGPVTDDQVID